MLKKCIWCSKDEQNVTFNNIAHTIPKSLGGKHICLNVCDYCNSFFGNRTSTLPSVEMTFKEVFAAAQYRFHSSSTENKKKDKRYTSQYFNIKNGRFNLKSQYKFNPSFQSSICRQFKKGIFKVFLEETERQLGKGHDIKYDFIREFCRYDFGDYPVIYFERLNPIYIMPNGWIESPIFIIDSEYKFKYLLEDYGFFEFELLGHTFGIPTIRNWELTFELYINESCKIKEGYFKSWKKISNFNDIDLLLNILDIR